MDHPFVVAIRNLFSQSEPFFNAQHLFNPEQTDAQSIVSAFLLALGGDESARTYLRTAAKTATVAEFFHKNLERVEEEIQQAMKTPGFAEKLEALAENPTQEMNLQRVFFPEGVGLPDTRDERVQALRKKRKVQITKLNPSPLTEPGRELLFTSNVLLTLPAEGTDVDALNYRSELKEHIRQAIDEEQLFWFDHPIQIGVAPEANEILYGLRGLNEAIEFERIRGNMSPEKAICILSVSVTHQGLHHLAKDYVESEIRTAGGFKNLEVYVFTETETDRLINEVLVPAGGDADLLNVLGVDGEYGRHYSFLKAIAALWGTAIDPQVKATFKIDLDQIFPQHELVEQSGASAFEHFKTPLWGARGTDAKGNAVELGMIAGALVNEQDIHKGLFTPDVPFPKGRSRLEDTLFFSRMLMALSTEAELMTRYGEGGIDGKTECIQRIHVTGGTNGILIDSLKRHRPFTPSFMGRAEDQSYILSVLMAEGEQLAYLHEEGLVMRHDKDAFAGDAIQAASQGKMMGDLIRMLYFSEYASLLTQGNIEAIKQTADPFTGCFITPIPTTVVLLRFCLQAAQFFLAGEQDQADELLQSGAPRLTRAMDFTREGLHAQYHREREGWNQFYDLLETIENHEALRTQTAEIIKSCRVDT
ncbi:MAG: hypothetical protein V5783_02545 [Pontiella sp.]